MKKKYQVCTKCVMDTSDYDIVFDENGVCNHCRIAKKRLDKYWIKNDSILNNIVDKIRKKGKNNRYDCIIGLSGGVDSTFLAYKVKQLGLNPLAIHFDNGWNTELAVNNIENIVKKLNIDLYTYVVNWQEFKDLQLAFLKSSTPDAEIPTDHAIIATVYKLAVKYKIKYIISGDNVSTESVLPKYWSHGHHDWKYIKNIYKKFGKFKISNYPKFNLFNLFYYKFIKRLKVIKLLNYIDYNKDNALNIIKNKLDWRDYGMKHEESIYTRFFQNYYLIEKFGFDKRRIHYSSLINSDQMSRQEAFEKLKNPPYNKNIVQKDMEFILNKFEINKEKFVEILNKENKFFFDYNSYEKNIITNFLLKLSRIW